MDELQAKELAALVAKYSRADGENETVIPKVTLFRASSPVASVPSVYDPCLCIIAQGEKVVSIEDKVFHYLPSKYLAVAVDLPLMNRIIKASKDEPYLLMKIAIDAQELSELVLQMGGKLGDRKEDRGIFVASIDEQMADSILKLARMLETPQDVPILASQTIREIFYRVLRSDNGNAFVQISLYGSRSERIARAIKTLRRDFNKPISMEELANEVGMSVSSFHSHFRAVTGTSPLQFQKALRLIEARRLMVATVHDSASAAFAVGYESPSQFSREYSRMFGNPPAKDVSALRMSES